MKARVVFQRNVNQWFLGELLDMHKFVFRWFWMHFVYIYYSDDQKSNETLAYYLFILRYKLYNILKFALGIPINQPVWHWNQMRPSFKIIPLDLPWPQTAQAGKRGTQWLQKWMYGNIWRISKHEHLTCHVCQNNDFSWWFQQGNTLRTSNSEEIAITACEPNIAEPRPPNCFTLPPISAGTVDEVIVEWMVVNMGRKTGSSDNPFRSLLYPFIVFVFFPFSPGAKSQKCTIIFFWVGGGACSVQ